MIDYDRYVPPQNLEAECSVLGAILLENNAMDEVLSIVRQEDFYRESHRKIFRGMVDLAAKQEPVDIITLGNRLKASGDLEGVGGSGYLASLNDFVPTAVNVGSYAKIVHECSKQRSGIHVCRQALDSLYAHEGFDDVKASLDEGLSLIVAQSGDLDGVLDGPGLTDAMARDNGREGIRAGAIPLFSKFGGLVAGDQVALAARPGMLKSSLAWNLSADVCVEKKIPTVIFSLEMTKEQVGRSILAKLEGVAVSDLPRVLDKARLDKISNSPIRLIDKSNTAIDQIERIARHYSDTKLVIVDHLQRVEGPRAENRNLQVGQIARRLKGLAKDRGLTVVTLCQLNRVDECEEPTLSALRDSGEIEQESDAIIFLWSSEKDNRIKRVINLTMSLSKNRHGPTARDTFRADKALKTLTDINGEVY